MSVGISIEISIIDLLGYHKFIWMNHYLEIERSAIVNVDTVFSSHFDLLIQIPKIKFTNSFKLMFSFLILI